MRPIARVATIDLLAGPSPVSASVRPQPSLATTTRPTVAPTPVIASNGNGGGLFDLDFNAPPPPPAPKRDAKADILSLFSSAPSMSPNLSSGNGITQGFNGLSLGGSNSTDPWGAPVVVASNNGSGFGGAFSDFSSAPVTTTRVS